MLSNPELMDIITTVLLSWKKCLAVLPSTWALKLWEMPHGVLIRAGGKGGLPAVTHSSHEPSHTITQLDKRATERTEGNKISLKSHMFQGYL